MDIFKKITVSVIIAIEMMLMIACERELRPKNILTDEQMENVMYDLSLADGAMVMKNIGHGDSVRYEYYQSVLKKNGIEKADFDSTLVWYTKHMEQFEAVIEIVTTRLEKK